MTIYKHIGAVTSEIHDSMMRWCRRLLIDAGLDTVEVYGQFPPEGSQGSSVTLFLYQVVPDPKMIENSPGASLLGPKDRSNDRVSFVPKTWIEIGRALQAGLREVFPDMVGPGGGRGAPRPGGSPYPALDSLPAPLRDWYINRREVGDDHEWMTTFDGGEAYVLAPTLWWRPGLTITLRYIAVAGEPGRGTSDRTSSNAPISLAALSVLATAVQLERVVGATLPPIPIPDAMSSYCTALADALDLLPDPDEDGRPSPQDVAAQLRDTLERLGQPDFARIGVDPVHDLDNHEFALLMQALQRPLQAAVNLQLRLPLGSHCLFGSSAAVSVATHNPGQGGSMGGPGGRR